MKINKKTKKKDVSTTEKMKEVLDDNIPKYSPTETHHAKIKPVFSWWPIVAVILFIIFGGLVYLQTQPEMKAKALEAIGLTIKKKSVEQVAQTPKEVSKTQVAVKVIENNKNILMRSTTEAYFEKVESQLTNTDLNIEYLDYQSEEGKKWFEQANKKFLPLYFIDPNIEDVPEYYDFAQALVKADNGWYRVDAEGFEYLELPPVGKARTVGLPVDKAQLQIIAYESYTCGYCKQFEPVMKQLMEAYKDKMVVIYKNFDRGWPDTLLAQAAECSYEQNKFLQFRTALYDKQSTLFDKLDEDKKNDIKDQASFDKIVYEFIAEAAKPVGLNQAKLESCVKSKKYEQKIIDDTNEARDFYILGTPGIFLNHRFIPGALSYNQIKTLVDYELEAQK